jgi:formylglycine-generating enzyme required for sulfatase activity
VQELFERFSAAARAAMEDAAEEETETLDRLVPVERDAGTATTGASRRLPRWIRDRRVGLGAAAAVVGIGVLVLGIAMARRGGESSKSAGGGTIEVSHNGETTVPPVGPVVTPKPKPQWDPEVLSSLVNLGLEPAEEASISKKWPETVQRRDQKLQKLKRMGNYYIPADYAEDSPAGKGEQTGLPKVLVRQRLPNKESVRFILLEGSQSFRMGEYDKNADFDPQAITAHVRPLSSFYIQEHEVTNFELTQFSKMSHSADLDKDLVDFTTFASRFQTENKSSSVDDFPAAFVTHRLATAFAERMGGRLPSEGQWEFAARSRCALRDRMYVWGNDDANVERKANICGNNYQNAVMQWKEDKTLQGVYDLTGNVREWCRDVWEPFPPDRDKFNYVAVAGEGVTDPEFVIRGGSFETIAKTAKVVWRESYNGVRYKEIATKPVPDVGFRVVLEPIRIPDPTLAEDELAAQPEREAKP